MEIVRQPVVTRGGSWGIEQSRDDLEGGENTLSGYTSLYF